MQILRKWHAYNLNQKLAGYGLIIKDKIVVRLFFYSQWRQIGLKIPQILLNFQKPIRGFFQFFLDILVLYHSL